MTNDSQVTHAVSLSCLLHQCGCPQCGTEPLALKLVLGVLMVGMSGAIRGHIWRAHCQWQSFRLVTKELFCALRRSTSSCKWDVSAHLSSPPLTMLPCPQRSGAPLPAVLCYEWLAWYNPVQRTRKWWSEGRIILILCRQSKVQRWLLSNEWDLG